MAENTNLKLSSGPLPAGATPMNVAGTLINMKLVPLAAPATTPPIQSVPSSSSVVPLPTKAVQPKITAEDISLDEVIICWDCETSGVNPWEYQWLVASFWPIDTPKADMVTFASWDEEEITREVAEYLNSFDSFAMTGFNTAFDIRCMSTRFMMYQVPVPLFMSSTFYDTRDFFKKGTWKYVFSDQASGSLEDWIVWLYDEPKPYTIEECFAGLREDNMEPLIIRNRWDVGVEGDVFILSKYIEEDLERGVSQMKPTIMQRTEEEKEGNVVVACPVCKTLNEYELKNASQICYVCASKIVRPTSKEYLEEIVRPFVAPKESTKKTTAAK